MIELQGDTIAKRDLCESFCDCIKTMPAFGGLSCFSCSDNVATYMSGEYDIVNFSCQDSRKVKIVSALYGSPYENSDRIDVTSIVSELCNDMKQCIINNMACSEQYAYDCSLNKYFGDPVEQVEKILKVAYTCEV
jgi:hypothetical protein